MPGSALALAAPAAPAAAAEPVRSGERSSPVRTQPLAPGEVLFETGGIGSATARADRVTFAIPVVTDGTDQPDARRANQAQVRRIIEAARRAGVPADGFVAYGGSGDLNLYAHRIMESAAAVRGRVGSMLIIHLSDASRVDAVRAAIAAAGAVDGYRPAYALTDSGPARRAAQAQALAGARAEAEAYAAARNMRVARIVRISERLGTDAYGLVHSRDSELRRGRDDIFGEQSSPEIDIRVVVGVDFALAPR